MFDILNEDMENKLEFITTGVVFRTSVGIIAEFALRFMNHPIWHL